MKTADETVYIKRALGLARRGAGKTSPNPAVGAVIVKNNKIAGEGYHRWAGGRHAEIEALEKAGRAAAGSSVYVNMEPCAHHGKTPPCTDALIAAKIKRVVACMKDPNPLVSGRGFKKLTEAGIAVEHGIMEEQARILNEAYIKYITRNIPFVTVKAAMTLDGKIAAKTGLSRWITGEESRKKAHKLRCEYDAVMAGVETVIRDDPELTVRKIKTRRQPFRIILDSRGRTPADANIFKTHPEKVIIAAGRNFSSYKKLGARVITPGTEGGRIKLASLMEELGRLQIMSVLIEGGGETIYSAFSEKIADKILFFYAPKIFGGRSAPTAVEGDGIENPREAFKIRRMKLKKSGEDFLVEGYVEYLT